MDAISNGFTKYPVYNAPWKLTASVRRPMVRFSSHFAKQIPIKHIAGNAWALMKNKKFVFEYDQYHPIQHIKN